MTADVLIPGPIAIGDLSVEWEGSPRPLQAPAKDRIDTVWDAQVAAASASGRDLFNGPIVALRAFRREGARVVLTLAPSDYQTFLVTCMRDRPWFERHAPDAITPALGNSALLTCNGSAYLGVRSPRVSAYPGRAHVFGGVLDLPASHPPTVASLLEHLWRELAEELSLTPAELAASPVLLGLFRDSALHQPELVWHCPVRRPLAHVDLHEHDGVLVQPMGGPLDARTLTPIALAALGCLSR